MSNCRFNPTLTGVAHLGHLYMMFVNEAESRKHGGEFIVRIDDSQEYWKDKLGLEKINELTDDYYRICNEFFDRFEFKRQSMDYHDFGDLRERLCADTRLRYVYDKAPTVLDGNSIAWYAYTPRFTAEKVVMDFIDNINPLIRGIDLLPEYTLYAHYAEDFGFPQITHYYISRLRVQENGEVKDISKTNQNVSIQSQLKRFAPEDLVKIMKYDCLKDPKRDWTIDNLIPNPVIHDYTK